MKEKCPNCENLKKTESRLCYKCWMKKIRKPEIYICPICSNSKSKQALLCKNCYDMTGKKGFSINANVSKEHDACPKCSRLKSIKAKQCRRCWYKFSRGKNHPHYKGKPRPYGYVIIQKLNHPNADKNGRILEHRYMMSEKLGRPLFSWESVHHKNGIRHDNRLENLELYPSSEHFTVTKLITEIGKLYHENIILKTILSLTYKGGIK